MVPSQHRRHPNRHGMRDEHVIHEQHRHVTHERDTTSSTFLPSTTDVDEVSLYHSTSDDQHHKIDLPVRKRIVDKRGKEFHNSSVIQTPTNVYDFTVKKDYIEYLFSDIKPVQDVSCKGLIKQNSVDKGKAYMHMITRNRTKITSEEYQDMTRNCDNFIRQRRYFTTSFTTIEENFPIAYSIVAYKNVEQIERLLRLIYRPQNSYCIHMDRKTSQVDFDAVKAIASCFPNVVLPENRVSVKWGSYTVLAAELICMRELWKFKKWKYFINLTGQELPLKTNLELVRILQTMKGANIVGGSKNRVKYINYQRYLNAGPIPHHLTVVKGPVHVVVNRAFVNFALHDHRSLNFLKWLKGTWVPDESFFSTLNYNPQLGIPGSFLGDAEEYPEKPLFSRHKNWKYPNGDWNRPCSGKYIRGICIFGISDLHRLADTLGLFVNKVLLSYEHLTFSCIEEMILNRTRDDYLNQQPVNVAMYEYLDQIKHRLIK